MPRQSRAPVTTAPFPAPSTSQMMAVPYASESLVASAVRFPSKLKPIYASAADREWQRQGYRHYAICGEARYAARFFGHALSRAVLTVGQPDPTTASGLRTLTEGEAVDHLAAFFNGPAGQEQMLEAAGIHMTIAGEFFIVGRQAQGNTGDPEGGADVWEVISVMEMQVSGPPTAQVWTIKREGYADVVLGDKDVVIRVWNPDPEKSMRADSPFKPLLPVLTEIEIATRHIFSQMTSRLAGAGLMFVSQGLSFPPPPVVEGQPTMNEAQQLMTLLANVMETAVMDESSAAARVPIIVSVPEELMKSGKVAELMHFWSDLDASIMAIRDNGIRRFALGLEMPPEQLMGMASNQGTGGGNSNGVSHWGAWQIEESTIKMFVEPALKMVVNAATVGFLRPLLTDDQGERIQASTAALRLRPDRSKEAVVMYDRGEVNAEVMRAENGFDETDVMDDSERETWMLRRIASGQTPATPEMVNAALLKLGVDLGITVSESPGQPDVAPGRPQPSIRDFPQRPRTPEAAALLPVCHSLVLRALERAGNRLRKTLPGGRTVAAGVMPFEVHTVMAANGTAAQVMADAWTTAPMVLDHIEGVESEDVIAELNAYCTDLLRRQEPHTYERLAQFMDAS